MGTVTNELVSYQQLLKYKDMNKEMHPELRDFASNLSYKVKPIKIKNRSNSNWKKMNTQFKNNWLTESKFNQTDDQKLYSQIRSILNKLSGSNFNELANELIQSDIKNKNNLNTLVEIIFKKAIMETKFNDIYAKLCFELSPYHIDIDEEKVYFRELLLNKCQHTFEECISLDNRDDTHSDEDEEDIIDTMKFKEHVLGCMRFIGELYNNNLITNKIIYNCFLILFSKINFNKAHCIDSICTLMETVGKKFFTLVRSDGEILFKKINELKNNNKINKKDKFALMDLIDLKNDKKW
jgi:translation initiation factor 4G